MGKTLSDINLIFEIKSEIKGSFKKTIGLVIKTDDQGLLTCNAFVTTKTGERKEKTFESRDFDDCMNKFKRLSVKENSLYKLDVVE